MALPLNWIDRIFDKLVLAYGRDFTGRWDGLPMASIKTDWAHELSGFDEHPEAIKHALQHLPADKPPTVFGFRNLCISVPKTTKLELPAPPADPVFVAEIARRLHLTKRGSPIGDKDWAKRLKARDDAGDPLNMNQRRCYKIALGLDEPQAFTRNEFLDAMEAA